MNTPSGCWTGSSRVKNSSPSPITKRCIGCSWTMANRRTVAPPPGGVTAMRSRAPARVGVARRSTAKFGYPAAGPRASISASAQTVGIPHRMPYMPLLRPIGLALLVCLQLPAPGADAPRGTSPPWVEPYREPANRLIAEAEASDAAWQRLAYLTDTFGPRLSGSPNLAAAIKWAVEAMKRDGLENVHLEPVKVPHWVRGRESLNIAGPIPQPLVMLGLGNSVGTPIEGVEAELLIVRSFEELDAARDRVKGRIVLFNVPFTTYAETVRYRGEGASRAGALGAVAMLVRSVGPPGLRTPHTGTLVYTDGQPRIPAAAITTEDASRLQRMTSRGMKVRLRLRMDARFLPDADSANVVGEIRGREIPEEVVVIGGHLDSWDVGTGAT